MPRRTQVVFTWLIAASALAVSANAQSRDADELLLAAPAATQANPPAQGLETGGSVRAELASIYCTRKIEIAAQSDGLVEEMLVDEGSSISQGDTLLVIDSRVAKAELEVAKRELESAEIQAKQTANIEFSKAAYELAKKELDAEIKLWERRATTYSAMERKELEALKAKYSLDLADDEIEKARLSAAVAREKVNASQVRLELYQVIAPCDGVIVERMRDAGEWIRTGEPILRLLHMNEMKVQAFVPLDRISLSELHNATMRIRVRINPRQEIPIDAKVEFVSPEIKSGRVKIIARIANQKDVNGSWILVDGMSPEVEIIPAT